MIRYVGGKSRHAKQIGELIKEQMEGCSLYVEPFFGGGSLAKETVNLGIPRVCADIDINLITLYHAIQNGWLPPDHITEQEYKDAKADPYVSPLRSYIGFACSYGGKWFGGLARDRTGRRDLTNESYRRVRDNAKFLKDMQLQHKSYFEFTLGLGDLVYCDPPYVGTLGYGDIFNHGIFWAAMRNWSKAGAKVLVSEYTAPEDFICIWSKETSVMIHNQVTDNHKTEKVFMWEGHMI